MAQPLGKMAGQPATPRLAQAHQVSQQSHQQGTQGIPRADKPFYVLL